MKPNALPMHANGVQLSLAELLAYKNDARRFMPPAISIWSQLNGQHKSHKRGRGMDFSEVRPYQPGDDVRSIDWRVSARTGTTHTKLFTEEREKPIMLLVDLSPSMKFGSQLLLKSVQACHLAALLSWIAASQKDRIGAIIFNGLSVYECKPTARRQGSLQVLGALVTAHQELLTATTAANNASASSANALLHLERLCPKGSDITMVSDFYWLSAEHQRQLMALTRHNRVQCVNIFDPLEKGQTEFRGHELVADGRQSAWLNFASEQTRQQLLAHFDKRQALIKGLIGSQAINLYSLSAAKPLLHQFSDHFARS